jgi:hypothetical protein
MDRITDHIDRNFKSNLLWGTANTRVPSHSIFGIGIHVLDI